MGDSFSRGLPGAGSQGDPSLDSVLTEEVAERLLGGWPRHAALAPDLRPLRETVDALRAAPSRSELRAEALALAAFRSFAGTSFDDTLVDGAVVASPSLDETVVDGIAAHPGVTDEAGRYDGMAHTLRLQIPREAAGHRPRRAKHRSRPEGHRAARPAGRAGSVVRRPRALGTAAAVTLLVLIGVFAYAGSLPGPIQNAAHVAFGAPPVKATSASPPSVEVTGSARASASPMTGAREIRPSGTSAPGPTTSGAPDGPKQWCQAYLSNPWKPGSTSWDKSAFAKLSKAAPGGARWVLWYCSKYVNLGHELSAMPFFFPATFPGGSWAWTPDRGHDAPAGNPGDVSDTEGAVQQGTIPSAAGGPGPARVSGQDAPAGQPGSSGQTSTAEAG
jgi:hypothetical protein